MSGWDPLPPSRVDRWLVAHRSRIVGWLVAVALAVALVVAWVVLIGDGLAPVWWPVVAYLVAQVGVVAVVLRRATLRCAPREPGRAPGAAS